MVAVQKRKGTRSSKAVEEVEIATISWPGLGIFFFWQLGVLQYLLEHYDLQRIRMVGSSAGGFIVLFAKCGVNPRTAIKLAHDIAIKAKVFTRPLGLLGVWGKLIEQWLDDLLPDDAAQKCNGAGGSSAQVLVTGPLPSFAVMVLDRFSSKADCISCAMASAHVPFFLDFKPTRTCRGLQLLDGSFRYVVFSSLEGFVKDFTLPKGGALTALLLALVELLCLAAQVLRSIADLALSGLTALLSYLHPAGTPPSSWYIRLVVLDSHVPPNMASPPASWPAHVANTLSNIITAPLQLLVKLLGLACQGLSELSWRLRCHQHRSSLQGGASRCGALLVEPRDDLALMRSWSLLDCLKLLSLQGALDMCDLGYQHAARMAAAGQLGMLKGAALRR